MHRFYLLPRFGLSLRWNLFYFYSPRIAKSYSGRTAESRGLINSTKLAINNLFFPPALKAYIKCEKCKNDFSLCNNFNEEECERKKLIQQNYTRIIYS